MIMRYSRPEMQKLWSETARYGYWLRVEQAVCAEMANRKKIRPAEWKTLRQGLEKLSRKGLSAERILAIEAITKHDVLAFTQVISEELGFVARHVHFGLTSSDVIDTGLALQIRDAGELIQKQFDRLERSLARRARECADLPTMGRSHGMYAEPTSFGLKFAGWLTEFKRHRVRFEAALSQLSVGKLSGAVGVNAHWDLDFERSALKRLGLEREDVSTQVIPRDRHAELGCAFALIAGGLERIAVELRHLQRSEVAEVVEHFSPGQKGSSAMPHKKNPISSENLTGCARLLRSYVHPLLENMALWHERDISHSSVERVVLADSFILAHYALDRLVGVIDGLWINRDRIRSRVEEAGDIVFSGHLLLALVEAGVAREDAYAWVQDCALKANRGDFISRVQKHPQISKYLKPSEIKKRASLKYQLRHARAIVRGALGA